MWVGFVVRKIREVYQLRVIKIDLPATLESIEIHTFADLHIGDTHCDMALIRERIKGVAATKNAYAILNGDLLNNATITSVSDTYSEDAPPMEQIKRCVDLFEPIKDKIIAVTTGNHEARTYRKEGIDLTEVIAMQMGLHERYSQGACVIFIRFGTDRSEGRGRKRRYSIYCIHGSGGGRREGGKINRLADLASIVDTDIYIHSHVHLPVVMRQGFFRADSGNSSVAMVDKLFVNTGAALDYGGYGERFAFKPASKATPIIYLNAARREMSARL